MAKQGEHGIAWTEETWNPIRGCTRVSPGCVNCYAEAVAARFNAPGQPYEGLATRTASGPRWTGVVRLVEEHLADPLRWTKPRMVFVNSMSDLFHEGLDEEAIAAIFGVMALAPQHTFQVLTKRAARMRQLLSELTLGEALAAAYVLHPKLAERWPLDRDRARAAAERGWPLPHVWLGVSAEDQQRADERIPKLLFTPAVVRWVSYEPALGPVDWTPYAGLDWIVVGGESGPGARPFDAEWARDTLRQCRATGTACFVKQLGARPYQSQARGELVSCYPIRLQDRKGGDMAPWPADLRVREFPEVAR